MVKDILDAAKAILPPNGDATDAHVYRWRLSIAAAVIFMVGSLTAHIVLACGFLPAVFPGFAKANAVKNIEKLVIAERADSLQSTIFTAKRDQCFGEATHNAIAVRAATARLYALKEKYRDTVGYAWQPDVPSCEELP